LTVITFSISDAQFFLKFFSKFFRILQHLPIEFSVLMKVLSSSFIKEAPPPRMLPMPKEEQKEKEPLASNLSFNKSRSAITAASSINPSA